ncbi:MAG: MBL fold metallo-hydrolase, partial [Acidobacteria bacterium]|nr:MBL fold metallo-hydrolase [Acidobacteriota bacterium]
VLFVGTGHPDIFPERPRMQSGIVVDVMGDRWLFDAGAGVLARMFDNKRPPATISHIFLSHLHYDHCLDLDSILLAWRTGGPGPGNARQPDSRTLTLYGPDGADKMVRDLFDVAYSVDGRGRALLKMPAFRRVRIRDAGVVEGKGYKTSFHEVKHANMDCWAVKMETPRGVLVFSGDLGGPNNLRAQDNAPFAEWAKGADMLIIDTLHMPPEELANVAATVKPKTLVLSHLTERFLPLFKHYDLKKTVDLCSKQAGKVVVAQEGLELLL